MPRSSIVPSHKNTLIREDTAIARIIDWKKFTIYGLWFVLICYTASSGWLAYTSKIWLAKLPDQLIWGIERLTIIFGLFVLIGLTQTSLKILSRLRLEQNLRFDVFAAVCEVTGQALARHLPDYQKLTTVVALGEDLLTPAKQVSERVSRLMLALQPLMTNLGLADLIDKVVRDSLKAADVTATVSLVESVLTRIEAGTAGDTVVPFERQPSN